MLRIGRMELIRTTSTLFCAFLLSGYVGSIFEALYSMAAALGVSLTAGRHRALTVLFSHLAWVAMACRVLGVRLKPFFPPPLGKGQWLSLRWRSNWLPWAAGGYFASLLCYNGAESLNRVLLPAPPPGLEIIDESVVSRLVHPEDGDRIALALGSLAPCLTAPVFEEVLYRGFLLPALTKFVPLGTALPLHALLFGLHHHALPALLPLSALGLLWGALYVLSGNLLVPMLIHAMWNSRIFITSLCGLG